MTLNFVQFFSPSKEASEVKEDINTILSDSKKQPKSKENRTKPNKKHNSGSKETFLKLVSQDREREKKGKLTRFECYINGFQLRTNMEQGKAGNPNSWFSRTGKKTLTPGFYQTC